MLKKEIKIPNHVAIIMDGNGRWAKERGKQRYIGHREGLKIIEKIILHTIKSNIKYLTLYAFSKENWARPKKEVNYLFSIFGKVLDNKKKFFLENKICFRLLGDLSNIFPKLRGSVKNLIELTKDNTGLYLNIAFDYSSRWEIIFGIKSMIKDIHEKKISCDSINEDIFNNYLQTSNLPDPDLLIRTSGEYRVSNFLLWQLAYTEIYITKTYWPDFNEASYDKAILEYSKRKRRFGKISTS